MSHTHSDYLEAKGWVKREKKEWFPKLRLILAFIIGLLLLSPAILGIYWELLWVE